MISLFARAESWLLALAVAGYFAATLGVWSALLMRVRDDTNAPNDEAARERKSDRALGWGRGALLLAVVAHAVSLVGQGSAVFGVRAGAVGLFGWILGVFALSLRPATAREKESASQTMFAKTTGAQAATPPVMPTVAGTASSVGAFVLPIALVAGAYSLLATNLHRGSSDGREREIVFYAVHVAMFIGGYVALAWAFALALVYLLGESLLKRKSASALRAKLPPLWVADGWIYRATLFGAGLLTLGIATGAILYASRPMPMAPLSDPKVVVSLLTWLAFAMSLIARWLGWRGRRVHLVVVCGFVLLAISFLGTPHWLNAK